MGQMLTVTEIQRLTGGRDGTFRAVPGLTYSGITLVRVTETEGYEVAYDAIAPEERPTEGGARAYLSPGDRVGVWTDSHGVVYVDRTVHVDGPRDIAWIIGSETAQRAIWDWANGIAIDELGREV